MAFRWRANDGQTLNYGFCSFVNFQGILTGIAKKPYIFVIFQGADPLSPSGSAHAKRVTHSL